MKHFVLFFVFLVPSLCIGQGHDNFESPYSSLKLFIESTPQENYNPEQASALFSQSDITTEEATDLVVKLDQLLRGGGVLIFLDEVPKESHFYDKVLLDSVYVISTDFPEIFLKRTDGLWRFQRKQINEIREQHNQMFHLGAQLFSEDKVRETFLGTVVFGLRIWQWLGVLIFLILGTSLRLLLSLFFRRLMMRFISGLGKADLGHKYLLPVSRPAGMLVVLVLVALFYPVLSLPGLVGYFLVLGLKGLIPFFGMIVLYRFVDILGVVLDKLALKTESTLDDQLVPLLKKILKVVVVIAGGLIIMDSLNIPIIPLLTGLSIGGLAFALAAQDTIKNFFGSLMIFIDKPFQIGDWISTSNIDGTVEEVGFRSTRVRTFRNSVVYVPNGILADSVVDNHGLRKFRRFKTNIAVKYDTPPDRIEVFVEGLKELVLRHPKTNKENHQIYLNDMGASSLDILFYIFFEAPTWSDELQFRQELVLDILRLGETLSVHFAFPTQTVHIENLPGQESLSPQYTWTKSDLRDKLSRFLKSGDEE